MASRQLRQSSRDSPPIESSNLAYSTSDHSGSPLSHSGNSEDYRAAVHQHSLSAEDEVKEREDGFLSPRDAQDEYVSNFVAFGKPLDRDVVTYESHRATSTLSSASALGPSELVPQFLALQQESQQKDEIIASLHSRLDDNTASFKHEKEILSRELQDLERTCEQTRRTLEIVEDRNRQLAKALQEKQQQFGECIVEVQELREQLATAERDKEVVEAALLAHQQKADETDVLRSQLERLSAIWRAEKVQLMEELQDARDAGGRKAERKEAELQRKRIEKVEEELKKLSSRFRRRKEVSPNRSELSPRVVYPRSLSHAKPRKAAGDSAACSPRASAGQKKLLKDLCDLFGVGQTSELFAAAKRVHSDTTVLKRADTFVKEMRKLVADVSPPGTFAREATLHQLWKWLKRLIDEYMLLRRNRDECIHNQAVLKEAAKLLDSEPGSELHSLHAVLKELHILREIETQLRAHLNLSSSQSPLDVLTALRELRT